MIVLDGKQVASNDKLISLTEAEYQALSTEEKMNPNKTYFITDSNSEEYLNLVRLQALVGPGKNISTFADGTVIGAILDLYTRMGGVAFSLTDVNGTPTLNAEYRVNTSTGTPIEISDNATDAEKIEMLQELIGSETNLNGVGYNTVIAAIVDLHQRLNGFTFSYNQSTGTVSATYNGEVVSL
jgi:hypothetical protein